MKYSTYAFALLLVMGLLCSHQSYARPSEDKKAQNNTTGQIYTKEHPLIYEDANDLWPYAFHNENGEDMGYNIDLTKAIMEKLDIPYIIRLKKRSEVLRDLKEGRADLTLGMDANFHNPFGTYGKSITQLFTHSVVWPVGQPQSVSKEEDLAHQQVYVHKGSFSHHLMMNNGWGDNAIPYSDMRRAILEVSQKGKGQVIWNTVSLKWLLHMYHIENLKIAPVTMSDGEYKFMSNNEHLLALIDSVYNEMDAEDQLESLQSKWLYPEVRQTGIPNWMWHVLNAGVVLTVLGILLVLLSRYRENKAQQRTRQRTRQLALILHASHLSIWLYDVKKKEFIWVDKEGKIGHRYSVSQFTSRLSGDNLSCVMDCVRKIEEEKIETGTVELNTFAESDPTGGDRTYEISFSVLRRHQGRPTMLISICNDITEERERKQSAEDRLHRYHSVFTTAMVDMFYYDKDGYLANMNERAQRTFGMTMEQASQMGLKLNQLCGLEGYDEKHPSYFHASQFVGVDGSPRDVKAPDAMVYEMQLLPTFDSEGRLKYTYSTGRDVTEAVRTYRSLQSGLKQVQEANKSLKNYVRNINYVMDVGGVKTAFYSPDNHTLTIYKDVDTIQHRLTQSRCMLLVDDKNKKDALRLLNSMDNRTKNSIEADILTTLHIKGRPFWVQLRFVPICDDNGQVTGYFGLCRDQSEIKATELLLQKESVRAQEVEDLKNTFLRNMSYEIRTPLSTVVGFAELFELDHSSEDESVFIQEIKENSAYLLQLINDILFLSRLDAHMIEINPQPSDIPMTFEGFCQIGWNNYQKEGVRYIVESHYDHLVVDIDETNLGRIIEQITANAAQHTTKGTVRARYDYINGKLVIMIEDTGRGMSEETLAHIYERFATGAHQGTGLGLPICKELAEQMGGSIEISSSLGKGTTVWITMPCKATTIDRKTEI